MTKNTTGATTLGTISFKDSTTSGAISGITAVVTEGKAASSGSTTHTGTAATTEIDFTGLTGEKVIGGKIEIGSSKFQFVENAGDVEAGHTAVVVAKTADAAAIATALAGATTATFGDYTVAAATGKVTFTETTTNDGTVAADLVVEQEGMGGLNLQIGASAGETISVGVDSMKADALGINALDISSESAANAAIDTINSAIELVSVTRGNLGAIQNRLEHTINNLGVMEENIQDAESTIRDTDVADEMMAYTKNNILIQSAQAMLAQANQVPQGVLQLMQ